MNYPYVLTYSDFLAAQKLHIQHIPKLRFWFIFWQRVLPVASVLSLVLVVRDMLFHHFSYPPLIAGMLCGLVWVGFYAFLSRPFLLKRMYRALRPEIKGNGHPIEVELRDGIFISRIPHRSEGRFERNAITDFAENDQIALLYVGPKRFLYLPKPSMPESAWEELRVWLGVTPSC